MSDYNYGQQPPGGVPPGYPPQPPGSYLPYPPPDQQQHQPGNGIAVAGMVLGIISVVMFWIPVVDAILGLIGLILSFAGMNRANSIGGKGKGMAIAGLVCSIVGLLLGAYVTYAFFVAVDELERRRGRWGLFLPVAPVLVGAAADQLRRVLARVGGDLRADRGM